MAYRNEILLGRIVKTSGFDGTVAIRLEKSFIEQVPYMESVFLEIEGRPVPFFIVNTEYAGGDIIKLRFEDYDSAGKVSEFTGCRVFLTSVSGKERETSGLSMIEGFEVYDSDEELVGTIQDIIQNPAQLLLEILSPSGREILIPFHEDFIISINRRKKKIVMDLPDGLTGLN